MLDHLTDLGVGVTTDVATALAHNWPFLLASVVVASVVQVYVKPDRLGSWLRRRTWAAVPGAVSEALVLPPMTRISSTTTRP